MSQELDFTPQQDEDVEMTTCPNEPATTSDPSEEELSDSENEAQENPYPPQDMDLDTEGSHEEGDPEEATDKKSGARSHLNSVIGTRVRVGHFKAVYKAEAGSTSKLTAVFWTVVLDHVATEVARKIQATGVVSSEHFFDSFFFVLQQIFSVNANLFPGMLQESDFISSKYAIKKPAKLAVKKQENPSETEKTAAKKKKKKTLEFLVTVNEIFAEFGLKVPMGHTDEVKHRFAYALWRVALFIVRKIKTHSDCYKKKQVKYKHCVAVLGSITGSTNLTSLIKKANRAIDLAKITSVQKSKSEPASE